MRPWCVRGLRLIHSHVPHAAASGDGDECLAWTAGHVEVERHDGRTGLALGGGPSPLCKAELWKAWCQLRDRGSFLTATAEGATSPSNRLE